MRRTAVAVALVSVFVLGLHAVPVLGSDLISAKEVAEMVDDENLRIISARKPEDYKKVHIKGAINVWHKDLYQEGDVKGLLKSPDELAEILGTKGIGRDNTIVIYDDGKGKSSGRLYWVLRYLGAEDVRILDGHMKKWRKARKPVTKDVPSFEPTAFAVSPDESMIALADELGGDGVLLVDVRSEDEYNGVKGETQRKGRIPGAIWFDYATVLNEDGTVKTEEELTALVSDAGITPDKHVILYCETSVRAGIVYLVLDDILGFPNVEVYDGAYYEWAADPARPTE